VEAVVVVVVDAGLHGSGDAGGIERRGWHCGSWEWECGLWSG
jgi:hypothetical protein